MKRDVATSAWAERADAVKALGATSLFLFGSTERDDAGQLGPASSRPNRGFGATGVLMVRLVRPALRAVVGAIDGIDNASRGKTFRVAGL